MKILSTGFLLIQFYTAINQTPEDTGELIEVIIQRCMCTADWAAVKRPLRNFLDDVNRNSIFAQTINNECLRN